MRMTEREELLKRLERVKALAERGVGGEKENAEALLKRLMAKYGISEDDIEDMANGAGWLDDIEEEDFEDDCEDDEADD